MPKDLLNRDNFGLLPEPEGRWGSFGVSMVTNIIIMSLLVLLLLRSIKWRSKSITRP